MNVAHRVGYRSALIAFVAGAAYDVAQLLQIVGILKPPWDGVLIFGTSLVIAVPFTVAIVALHQVTPIDRQLWTQAALSMSVVYVTYVTLNYAVQLAVVIPRLTTPSAIAILDQTPHSLLWTIDGLGYIFLGAATLFAAPALVGHGPRVVPRAGSHVPERSRRRERAPRSAGVVRARQPVRDWADARR